MTKHEMIKLTKVCDAIRKRNSMKVKDASIWNDIEPSDLIMYKGKYYDVHDKSKDSFGEYIKVRDEIYYVYLESPAGTELIGSGDYAKAQKIKTERMKRWKPGYPWSVIVTNKRQRETNYWDSSKVKDEETYDLTLDTIDALIKDEEAARDAYNVAIENLKDKLDDKDIEILTHIKEEEDEHILELQAIKTGKEALIKTND